MAGNSKTPNKALHRTAIPLRSIAAGELRSLGGQKTASIYQLNGSCLAASRSVRIG